VATAGGGAIADRPTGPDDLDRWLAALGLVPVDSGAREGIASRDLILDGRVRMDVRITLILDPAEGVYCWAHYAPPINDSFRVSYRKLLRWNDEIPFVKFAVAEDDRPVLLAEVPAALLSEDTVGRALARLLTVCDLLYPASLTWLHPGARRAPKPPHAARHLALLDRYAAELGELAAAAGAAAGAEAEVGAAEVGADDRT
jgi:hypothetical protein